MQTFVPYADFDKSARVLDSARLGKQRSETMIIWNTLTGFYERTGQKGWPHHPATRMWKSFEPALLFYGLAVCSEWQRRGYADNGTMDWFVTRISWQQTYNMPWWWGRDDVHRSHRSQLLAKDPKHYKQFWPRETPGMGYVWPGDGETG